MKIQVFIRHGVDMELVDLLEKVDTAGEVEVCGSHLVLSVSDPDEIPSDIRKIARAIEKIQEVYLKVGYPRIAREVLEGRAYLVNGQLVYKPKYKPRALRVMLEQLTGPLTDEEFRDIMEAATDDIKVNRIAYGKRTTLDEAIKIAARCAEALKKCG